MKWKLSRPRPGTFVRWNLALLTATALTLLTNTAAHAQGFPTLFSFTGDPTGEYPGQLVVGPDGSIFGVTQQGGLQGCEGSPGCGVVYVLSPSGVETVLHKFAGSEANDGAGPEGVILDAATRTLYGAASGGGIASSACVNGCGTVFEIDSNGKETTLHAFTNSPDGNLPLGTPVMDSEGNLYGVTFYGGGSEGQSGSGTVYKVSSSGEETVIYEFSGANGTNPNGSLIRDAAGNLYGTTTYGGTGSCNNGFLPGCGVVFKLDSAGNETVLHDFTGGQDSQYPRSLARDAAGNIYGLASYNGYGEIFKINTEGGFQILDFGAIPGTINEIILGAAGSFYATTNGGNSNCSGGCGSLLQLYPNGTGYYNVILLISFSGTNGDTPVWLTQSKGILYGTTFMGGTSNYGTVYKYKP